MKISSIHFGKPQLITSLSIVGIFVLSLIYVQSSGNLTSSNLTSSNGTSRDLSSPKLEHTLVSVKIGDTPLQLEVVNTPRGISRGLSGRDAVQEDGMLFVFSPPRQTIFWMPEMRFDLDIIWIADGEVTGIERNVPRPAPESTLATLPRYPSPGIVEYVVELPAGKAEALGITIDSQFSLKNDMF